MRKIIVELNEINIDLLKDASVCRPNIKHLLGMGYGSFEIPDTYESDFLEPWCQWVTAHTGVKSEIHNIKHLGDVKNLEYPEVWDTYQNSFGVIWGCLNSKTPKNENIIYFPDPWTNSSKTTRWYLRPILNFLKYAVSKRSESNTFRAFGNFLWNLPSVIYTISVLLFFVDLKLLKSIVKLNHRMLNSSMLYSTVEYLLFKVATFLGGRENKLDVIFLNMIAHAQHYYWKTERQYILEFALDRVDNILSICRKKYSKVLVYNGLSQEYSGNKERWHSWVPTGGWSYFVKHVLKVDCAVAPCMSYDCNLYFKNENDALTAIDKIANYWVSSQSEKLFLVEKNPADKKNIFIRLSYYGPGEAKTNLNNSLGMIAEFFDLAAIRTGRHEQYSVLIGQGANQYNRNFHQNTQVISIYRVIDGDD